MIMLSIAVNVGMRKGLVMAKVVSLPAGLTSMSVMPVSEEKVHVIPKTWEEHSNRKVPVRKGVLNNIGIGHKSSRLG